MRWLGRWFGRYAPKGNGRVAGRVGCLVLFPFITLFVWMVQAIVWLTIAAPILAYAIVMAVMGGGFRRDPTTRGPHTPGEARSNSWIGRDGGM